ncbi:MAG: aminoacyl-tRNA hydrolase [Bacteriovoracaceae bacterium]|nr:aminoacyl-tRNA hydrolase [Bacteriovoracaceae bacterium]
MDNFQLIVALGNPGAEYEKTRHNAGFMVLDQLIKEKNIKLEKKFKGEYGTFEFMGRKIFLLKPQTFMNCSGESVREIMQFFKIPLNAILVLHDELDIPFGHIMFKKGGGLAGHNGLKSIAQELSSQDFARMRIGISRPPQGWAGSWVLDPFSKEEKEFLSLFMQRSQEALLLALQQGLQKVSGLYNKKNLLEGLYGS